MIELVLSVIVLCMAGYLIAKNYDAKIVLLAAGLILLFAAAGLGHSILPEKLTSGSVWLDPFVQIKELFVSQFARAGIIIMVLFGFSAYMSHIGANEITVQLLSKPVQKIRSKYILVPVVFWLGTALSLIIPSAASLALLLMATLYPILRASGMSALTAGGVIATTATIMPTPLGGDNVVAARLLGFGDDVVSYVFYHHAPISLPVIVIMGFAHFFWQRYMDKRQGDQAMTDIDESQLVQRQDLPPSYYAIFPLIPLILVIFFNVFVQSITVGLVEITLFSFMLALLVEWIRKGSPLTLAKDANLFFQGMGNGFSQVVVLIVAASTMVAGLQSLGVIQTLSDAVKEMNNAHTALMFAFSGMTALITFISGSGNAVFYSFIELIPPIATQAGVDPIMVALPMQLTSNLIRAVSPVSAVVIIVASVVKVSPLEIVKRTSVPLLVGFVATMILALIRYW